MIVSFFEEFPTKENLEKLKIIDFPTKLYIASTSIKEFNKIKSKIKSEFVKEIIYWPLLDYNEGYWMSPLSKRKALQRIIKEVEDDDVMWDCEFPKKRSLIFTNFYQFFMNKKLIKKFFKEHKKTIYTAEYFPEKGINETILKWLGVMYEPSTYGNKVIKMVYSSMHDKGESFIKKEVNFGVRNYNEHFLVGLGTIATGILGNEPIITQELLKRDLYICRNANVSEVIIFRLGGLNKELIKTIKKIF